MSDFSDEAQIAVLDMVLGWIDRGQLGAPSQRAYAGSGLRKVIDRHRAYLRRKREGKSGDMAEAIFHLERLIAIAPGADVKRDAMAWLVEKKRGEAR